MSLPGREILESADEKFWRQEVISRVQQHRARRRRRFDPHSSMELDFPAGLEPASGANPEGHSSSPRPPAKPETPKIIEFPRPATVSPGHPPPSRTQRHEELELAERIVETPRILDSPEAPPEQMDLLPKFADIELVAEEVRRSPELDLPLQPAATSYRVFAGLVDLTVVLTACALFVFGPLALGHGLPPLRFGMLYGLVVWGTVWFLYQYLFLVFSAGTPGMQVAQLELCTFSGEPAPVRLRRWRALASVLSAFALGLGYAWAFLDEDTLGWHDRITQTYVRRS